MKTRTLIATALGALCAGLTFAQQPVAAPGEEAPVFGAQIMTEQERVEHRERMRAAGTPEEREQLRLEHHKQMVERARERGVTLPDEPPMRGGMGAGGGMGPSMRMPVKSRFTWPSASILATVSWPM
ncbi:MAG TPA: hypothetical protein PLE66_11535 [Thauera aminoaromatica]|nr:hypothetical protein [Thauera aminoaromatica]